MTKAIDALAGGNYVAIDDDTAKDLRSGELLRTPNIQAPELKHGGTNERLQRFLQANPGATPVREGHDIHGRPVADFITPEGVSYAKHAVATGVTPRDWNRAGFNRFAGATLVNTVNQINKAERGVGGDTVGLSRLGKRGETQRSLRREFGAGIQRGVDSLQAGMYGAVSAVGEMFNEEGARPNALQRFGESGYMRNVQEAERNAATQDLKTLWEEGGGVDEWLRWGLGVLGEALPSMGAMLAGGGVGAAGGKIAQAAMRRSAARKIEKSIAGKLQDSGVAAETAKKLAGSVASNLPRHAARAGALGASGLPQGGQIYEEIKNEYNVREPVKSLLAGLGAGALDVVGLEVILKQAFPGATTEATKHIAKRIFGGATAGAFTEAPTEATQELIAILTKEGANPNPDAPFMDRVFSEDNQWRMIEAAAAGGLFGSIAGGLGGTAGAAADRMGGKDKTPPPPEATTEPPPPPTESPSAPPPAPAAAAAATAPAPTAPTAPATAPAPAPTAPATAPAPAPTAPAAATAPAPTATPEEAKKPSGKWHVPRTDTRIVEAKKALKEARAAADYKAMESGNFVGRDEVHAQMHMQQRRVWLSYSNRVVREIYDNKMDRAKAYLEMAQKDPSNQQAESYRDLARLIATEARDARAILEGRGVWEGTKTAPTGQTGAAKKSTPAKSAATTTTKAVENQKTGTFTFERAKKADGYVSLQFRTQKGRSVRLDFDTAGKRPKGERIRVKDDEGKTKFITFQQLIDSKVLPPKGLKALIDIGQGKDPDVAYSRLLESVGLDPESKARQAYESVPGDKTQDGERLSKLVALQETKETKEKAAGITVRRKGDTTVYTPGAPSAERKGYRFAGATVNGDTGEAQFRVLNDKDEEATFYVRKGAGKGNAIVTLKVNNEERKIDPDLLDRYFTKKTAAVVRQVMAKTAKDENFDKVGTDALLAKRLNAGYQPAPTGASAALKKLWQFVLGPSSFETHHTSSDALIDAVYNSVASSGTVEYRTDGKKFVAKVTDKFVSFMADVLEYDTKLFREYPEDRFSTEAIEKSLKFVHPDIITDVWSDIVSLAERVRKKLKPPTVKPNGEFKEAVFTWTERNIGDEYYNNDLCRACATRTRESLRQVGLPFGIVAMSQEDTSGKFPGKMGHHMVAVTRVDGKTYIVDQPQKELWEPTGKGNTGKIKTVKFSPRFIEVTEQNLKKYYGYSEARDIANILTVLNGALVVEPVANTEAAIIKAAATRAAASLQARGQEIPGWLQSYANDVGNAKEGAEQAVAAGQLRVAVTASPQNRGLALTLAELRSLPGITLDLAHRLKKELLADTPTARAMRTLRRFDNTNAAIEEMTVEELKGLTNLAAAVFGDTDQMKLHEAYRTLHEMVSRGDLIEDTTNEVIGSDEEIAAAAEERPEVEDAIEDDKEKAEELGVAVIDPDMMPYGIGEVPIPLPKGTKTGKLVAPFRQMAARFGASVRKQAEAHFKGPDSLTPLRIPVTFEMYQADISPTFKKALEAFASARSLSVETLLSARDIEAISFAVTQNKDGKPQFELIHQYANPAEREAIYDKDLDRTVTYDEYYEETLRQAEKSANENFDPKKPAFKVNVITINGKRLHMNVLTRRGLVLLMHAGVWERLPQNRAVRLYYAFMQGLCDAVIAMNGSDADLSMFSLNTKEDVERLGKLAFWNPKTYSKRVTFEKLWKESKSGAEASRIEFYKALMDTAEVLGGRFDVMPLLAMPKLDRAPKRTPYPLTPKTKKPVGPKTRAAAKWRKQEAEYLAWKQEMAVLDEKMQSIADEMRDILAEYKRPLTKDEASALEALNRRYREAVQWAMDADDRSKLYALLDSTQDFERAVPKGVWMPEHPSMEATGERHSLKQDLAKQEKEVEKAAQAVKDAKAELESVTALASQLDGPPTAVVVGPDKSLVWYNPVKRAKNAYEAAKLRAIDAANERNRLKDAIALLKTSSTGQEVTQWRGSWFRRSPGGSPVLELGLLDAAHLLSTEGPGPDMRGDELADQYQSETETFSSPENGVRVLEPGEKKPNADSLRSKQFWAKKEKGGEVPEGIKILLDIAQTIGLPYRNLDVRLAAEQSNIAFMRGGRVVITINNQVKTEQQLREMAHELGHLAKETWLAWHEKHNSPIWKRLVAAHEAAKTDLDFDEWFAEEFAKWVFTANKNTDAGVVAAFQKLHDIYKKILGIIKKALGGKVDITMKEFFDGMALVQADALWAETNYADQKGAYGSNTFIDDLMKLREFHNAAPRSDGKVYNFTVAGKKFSVPRWMATNSFIEFHKEAARNITKSAKAIGNYVLKPADHWLRSQYTQDGRPIEGLKDLADVWVHMPGTVREVGKRKSGIIVPTEPLLEGMKHKYSIWRAEYAKIVEGMTPEQKTALMTEMLSGEPKSQEAKRLREFFDTFWNYYSRRAQGSKKWNDSYFPLVLDLMAVQKDPEGFKKLVMKETGVTEDEFLQQFGALIENEGFISFDEGDAVFAPTAKSAKERKTALHEVGPQLLPFLNQDLDAVMNTYVKQMTKRAEFEGAFGAWVETFRGGKMWNHRAVLDRFLGTADAPGELSRSGANPAQVKHTRLIIEGYMGRRGINMDPDIRRTMSWAQTLLSMLMLPFATLASFVDAANPVIRTGNVKGAGAAFAKAFKSYRNKDEMWRLAEYHGQVSATMIHDAIMQRFESPYMSPDAHAFNEKFFRFIGLQQWTNLMRMYAWNMAETFIEEHAGKGNSDMLAELDLTVEDVNKWIAGGRQRWTIGSKDANAAKIQLAINRFINESVFHPDASQRPGWASDPRFMLIWYLKQFGYSIYTQLLSRLYQKTKGKKGAMQKVAVFLPLLAMIPLAIVGLEIRNLLQYGLWGETPYAHKGDVADYSLEVLSRTGMLGPIQFLWDAAEAEERGRMMLASLLGPAATTTEMILTYEIPRSISKLIPGVASFPVLRNAVSDGLQL